MSGSSDSVSEAAAAEAAAAEAAAAAAEAASDPPPSSILFNALKFDFSNDYTGNPHDIDLSTLKTELNSKDGKVSAVLTKQKQVNNILQSEINRLNQKKTQLDNAQKGQMRVLMMNESYRKRQAEYIKLIIAVVFVFALVIIMRYMRAYFNVLPDTVYTLLHILLFSSVIIYSFVTYININSRETTNFDRLDMPAPNIEHTKDTKIRNKAAIAGGNLLGVSNSNLCKGAACCTADATEWNLKAQKCVDKCTTGNTWDAVANACAPP